MLKPSLDKYYTSQVVHLPLLGTRGTCEVLVGNENVESTNGEIVGHACGGASANAFIHLLSLFYVCFCLFFI